MKTTTITHGISEKEIDALEHRLWASLPSCEDSESGLVTKTVIPNVYAVLDGARNKRIEPMLNNGGLDYSCLYEDRLSYAMQRAAPHIVSLEKNHPLSRSLLRMGWSDYWGLFIICKPDVPMSSVRHNCRRIAKVKLPDNKTVVFRYYDPRVMNTLLPTCDATQLRQIYGRADKLAMPSSCAQFLNMYSVVDNKIVLEQFSITKPEIASESE